MPHNSGKERQEISLVGRLLSLETMLLMMGVASLIYGIVNGVETSMLWGVVIITGVFILMKVRRKDWQKHRQDPEAEQKARSGRKDTQSEK
jgi:flagellar biosynthesis component FlhA